MVDRTPVLLRSRSDFACIRHDAVGVAAIGAIQFLRREIGQAMPVDDDIVASGDLRNLPQPKADRLIKRNRGVKKRDRNDHCVNDRRRNQIARIFIRNRRARDFCNRMSRLA